MSDAVIGRLIYKITGDNKELRRELTKSVKDMERTAVQFQRIGRSLTIGVTAPITAVGFSMARAAIDAEETRAKFETAFRGIEEAADDTARNLADNYGLARDEAERLLSGTGDLLKGFGASADQALDLSNTVQQLSVDLSSYNNLEGGAARASEILTKAMLGERDALTSLGIKISEADVQQRLMERGQRDLTGQALLLARAQVTLELAMAQSGDAIGDFARTQDSAANQIRILKAEIRDLQVELGRELLPVVKDVLANVIELVQEFQDLDETQRENVIRVLAIAAALGPLSGAIGTAIKAVNALRVATLWLYANPIVAGIAVATLAVAGLGRAISNAIDDQKADDMERFAEAAEKAGIGASEYADAATRAELALSDQLSDQTDITELVRQLVEQYGLSLDSVIDISSKNEFITAEQRKQLDILRWEQEVQRSISDEVSEQKDSTNSVVELRRERLSLVQAEREEAERIAGAERARALAVKETRDEAWQETLTRYYQTQTGQLELLKKELEGYQNSLTTSDERYRLTNENSRRIVQEIIADIEKQIERTEDLNEAIDEGGDSAGDLEEKTKGIADNMKRTAEQMPLIKGWYEEIIRDASSWEDNAISTARIFQDGFGAAFEALGQDIVAAEDGFKNLKEAAKGVVVAVIKGLAEEFLIRAVAALIPGLTFNPVAAAGYAGVAAMAYTAAGAVSAFGSGGQFYADEPQLIMVGDKPEYVDIRPVDHVMPPGASGGAVHIHIDGPIYGYDDFARAVERAERYSQRSGRVRK